MALYKDGNPVSGLNSIPRLTLAQYNALNVKPEFWVRTDAPESYKKLSADQVSYDSNNTVKDMIDELNNNSLSAFSVVVDRVQIQSGGYYVKGDMVFVNIKFKALTTLTNIPAILLVDSSDIPNSEFSLLANDISNGIANVGENIPCGIETRGFVYISKIETNKIYQITGWYQK